MELNSFFVRLAVVALLLGTVGKSIYDKGYDAHVAEVSKAQSNLDEKAEQVRREDSVAEQIIVTEFVEVEKKVYLKGETIIKEIPVYVSSQASAACTLPLGFVSLYDRASAGAGGDEAGQEDAGAGAGG